MPLDKESCRAQVLTPSDDNPEVIEQLKQAYLQNELASIPVLLEPTGASFRRKVSVTVRPSGFVAAASTDRVEREIRVLESVRI
jgi:hypothetical protein